MPTVFLPLKPNAQTHLPQEAAARHERRLEAVRCSAVLGQAQFSQAVRNVP